MKNFATAVLVGCALCAFPVYVQAQDADKTESADSAEKAKARAAKQMEQRAKRMVQNAVQLIKDGETDRGVNMLEAIPKMFPDAAARFSAFLELGRHLASVGQNDAALAALRKVAPSENREEQAEALLLQARVHNALGRGGEASMLLRRVTTDYPDSPFANDAWYEIGQIHFKAKRWVRAQEAFLRVGTAVPRAEAKPGQKPAPVLAEAGQRLFVHVSDRDLQVLTKLGRKMNVKVAAKSGDTETLALEPFGQDGLAAIASVPTCSEAGAPEDGKLTVQGGDIVSCTYVDEANSVGDTNVPKLSDVRIVSSAVLSVMDGAYRQSVKGVFSGHPAFLRLRDLDLDVTPQPDKATVHVTTLRLKPKPTDEEIALGEAEPLDPEADPWEVIAELDVTLTETAPRSGVFEGRVVPYADGKAPTGGDPSIEAAADGRLVLEYTDKLHLGGDTPKTVTTEVAVLLGGSTEPQSIVSNASDASIQSRKLLLEAQLLHKWASIFKDVGLERQANEKADEGLLRVAEIFGFARRFALDRDIVENTYAAKWDLELDKGQLGAAIATCNALVNAFPDTILADVAFMRIGSARAASDDPKDLDEAVRIYRSVLGMPNSPNKAEAQFLLAQVLEKKARLLTADGKKTDFTQAITAYRQCAENYPESSFAGESFKRVVTYLIETRDLDRAADTLDRVFQDYPDAPWLDEMLLRWGIVYYRKGDRTTAIEKFQRVLEEYPGGAAAQQAAGFIQRLGGGE